MYNLSKKPLCHFMNVVAGALQRLQSSVTPPPPPPPPLLKSHESVTQTHVYQTTAAPGLEHLTSNWSGYLVCIFKHNLNYCLARLRTIYNDQIPVHKNILKYSKLHAILFADDTNLISTLCSFDVNIDNKCNSLQLSTNINKELKNIQIWLEINKLSLNVKKTKFMIFHHKQWKIENLIPQLNLNEQIIERVTDFDFLGLTIDQHLTWNGHVQKIRTIYQDHSGLCAN